MRTMSVQFERLCHCLVARLSATSSLISTPKSLDAVLNFESSLTTYTSAWIELECISARN